MDRLCDRSILVVEDDTLIQWGIEDALKSAGYTSIRLAANRREAREEINRSLPHLAILDIKLAHNTSVPLADWLAKAEIPFVFMSAYSPQFLPLRHRTRPFITKPFSPGELARQVHEALAKAAELTASQTGSSPDGTGVGTG